MVSVTDSGIFSRLTAGLAPDLNAQYIANRTFVVSAVDFSGDAQATLALGSATIAPATALALQHAAAASIAGVLKTPTIYTDDRLVAVLYSVRDAAGRTACNPSGASVSMSVGGTAGTCTLFSAARPVGLCTCSAGSSSATQAVTLTLSYGGVSVAQDTSLVVALQAAPQRSAQQTAAVGTYASLPQHPVYAGDQVVVVFSAQTGGTRSLSTFVVNVVFDPTALSYVSAAAPLFNNFQARSSLRAVQLA